METKENQRRGMSLIVLVITIIVIIILATAVILSLNNNNPITNAKKASFQSDLKTYVAELSLYVANEYTKESGLLDFNTISAQGEGMKTYIPSMQEKYYEKVYIEKRTTLYFGEYYRRRKGMGGRNNIIQFSKYRWI